MITYLPHSGTPIAHVAVLGALLITMTGQLLSEDAPTPTFDRDIYVVDSPARDTVIVDSPFRDTVVIDSPGRDKVIL